MKSDTRRQLLETIEGVREEVESGRASESMVRELALEYLSDWKKSTLEIVETDEFDAKVREHISAVNSWHKDAGELLKIKNDLDTLHL